MYLDFKPNSDSIETFSEYYDRINSLLPNFPKCVLQQWLFEHFTCATDRYAWLGFEKLSFRKECWSSEKILDDVKAWNELAVESWKSAFITSPDYKRGRLVDFMRQNSTWPVPPLVLDNSTGLRMPNGSEIARWELIEGHHRLAYFRALCVEPDRTAPRKHCLWLITRNKK